MHIILANDLGGLMIEVESLPQDNSIILVMDNMVVSCAGEGLKMVWKRCRVNYVRKIGNEVPWYDATIVE